jgi:hypothetical protein
LTKHFCIVSLEFELGPLNTQNIDTPSGGYHLYFKHPRDGIKNIIAIRPGIDIKTEGGYVPAAGSVINSKAYYVQRSMEPQELPQCWTMLSQCWTMLSQRASLSCEAC